MAEGKITVDLLTDVLKGGPGVAAIALERKRQIEEEGWSAKHDDQHRNEELAFAATCYAMPEETEALVDPTIRKNMWPWG